MNIYEEILKYNKEISKENKNDYKSMFDYVIKKDEKYTTEILDLCSYQPLLGPVGLSVLYRCGVLSACIEHKEVVARTRKINDNLDKRVLINEVEGEVINRMKTAGQIENENKKPFNYVLIPEGYDGDHDEVKYVIRTKHLTEHILYVYKGDDYLDQGFAYLPYKFIDVNETKIGFRYAINDTIIGSDCYFKTVKIG